jgi:hypothetical protein
MADWSLASSYNLDDQPSHVPLGCAANAHRFATMRVSICKK